MSTLHAAKLVHDQMKPALSGERIHDNVYWRGAAPRLSICVPVYRYDATRLLDALAACASSALVEIILYDDGSGDQDLLAKLESQAGRTAAAVRVVSAAANRGRSAARNAAIRHARTDWYLLLDADMIPDDVQFLEHKQHIPSEINLPPLSSLTCQVRSFVVVVMPALTHGQNG